MNNFTRIFGIAGLLAATHAAGQVTFYENEWFHGRSFYTDRTIGNLDRSGFNDRLSSVTVEGGYWQVCEHAGFGGRCVVLQPGRYGSLAEIGLDNQISSVRPVDSAARESERRDSYAYYHRRSNERLYEVPVTSVRAVIGPPDQRCWIEREQVLGEGRSPPNVGGAIAGAVIGGILGHQIGSGRGNDVATAGGAVAGAVIGSNVGREREVYERDVQRCTDVSYPQQPAYWDVTYAFNGVVHHIQTTEPPGPTITVNRDGEPRIG